MAIDWSQVGQNLSTLPGNPLFDLGIGLMANGGAAPYGTTLGQRFAGALQYMGNAQQTLARQRAFQQAQDEAEQDRQAKQRRQADLDKYLKSTPYANDAGFKALAAANPEAAAAYALRQSQADNASPWQFDARSGTMVNTKSGQFKPLTMLQAPGMPGFAAPQVGQPAPAYTVGGSVPVGSQITQATGADGTKVAFAFAPGTPDAVKAQAAAAAGIPQPAPAAPQGAPMTLAQYEARRSAQTKPGLIQQRMDQWQQLVQAGAADPTNTTLRNQYLMTGKTAGFQGGDTAPTLGDITKTGADYLGTLDPADRDVVNSYLTGRQKIPTGTALKNPHIMSLVQAAYHVDPELEAGTFDSRVKTRQAFTSATGPSSPAAQIQTLNTASGHLNQLLGDVMRLDNGSVNALNSVENYFGAKTGSKKFTDLEADLTPVASEVASLYKGGQATDAEIAQIKNAFPANGSKSQQISVLEHWIGLLHSKLGALNYRYTQGMGKMSDPLTTVNPAAAAALKNITQTYKTLGLPLPATIGEAANSVGGDAQTAAPASSGWSIQKVQ